MATRGSLFLKCLLSTACCFGIAVGIESDFPERRLVDDLLRNYNTTPRPVLDPGETVEVKILLRLGRIEKLSEKDQTLQSFGWLITSWRDVQLRWNSSEYGGADRVVLDGRYVWLPEMVLFNGYALDNHGEFKDFATSRVLVHSDGRVSWVPGISFRTSCDLDLTYFPYDIQKVCWVFVNWMYNASTQNVSYSAPTIAMDSYQRNGEWKAIKTEVHEFSYTTEASPHIYYPVVQFCLYIERRPQFYSRTIIMPCMTITLVSALVFILPAQSGEKVSFGISVMVSFTIFLLMISEVVPKNSVKMPFISTYMLANIIQMGVSLVATVMILNVYHHTPDKPVPLLTKKLFQLLARALCMRQNTPGLRNPETPSPDARRTDNPVKGRPNIPMRDLNASSLSGSFKEPYESHNGSAQGDPSARGPSCRHVGGGTLRNEQNREDWRFLARVLDRLMLIVYLITIILTTGSFCITLMLYDKGNFMKTLSNQHLLDPANDPRLAFS